MVYSGINAGYMNSAPIAIAIAAAEAWQINSILVFDVEEDHSSICHRGTVIEFWADNMGHNGPDNGESRSRLTGV